MFFRIEPKLHLYRGKIYLSQNLTNRSEPVQDLTDPPIEPERVLIYSIGHQAQIYWPP